MPTGAGSSQDAQGLASREGVFFPLPLPPVLGHLAPEDVSALPGEAPAQLLPEEGPGAEEAKQAPRQYVGGVVAVVHHAGHCDKKRAGDWREARG